MNPVLWGLVAALGFGLANFIARLSARAIGPSNSLLGSMVFGLIGLSLTMWVWQDFVPWHAEALLSIIAAGIGFMIAELLFYVALNRGPVSIAAPISSCFPVFVVAGALMLGIFPTVLQWFAMAGTMVGVLMVARTSREATQVGAPAGQGPYPTVFLSLGSAAIGSAALLIARAASAVYGEVQAMAFIRIVNFLALFVVMVAARRRFRLPLRWWPVLALQGLLDVGAFVALLSGLAGEGAALASVATAPYAVITVLLALVFLKEGVPAKQWTGILLVALSVAVLAYVG